MMEDHGHGRSIQASDSMVSPRQVALPLAPSWTIFSSPPPIFASPVSTAAWFFVMPPISASFS